MSVTIPIPVSASDATKRWDDGNIARAGTTGARV
jgi:hypothetical protein